MESKNLAEEKLVSLQNELSKKRAVRFPVKITAGSKKDELAGLLGNDTLKIKISKPATDGKANTALLTFLAKLFNVPKSTPRIVAGAASTRKIIEIQLTSKDS